MSIEKPKVEDLIKRIDELINIFQIISEDLKEISVNLRSIVGVAKPGELPISPLEMVEATKRSQTIDDIQRAFPKELVGMLYFEETGEYITVKPRQYLGPDNFAKIASIVRDQLKGEYVSAGKDSHFRVPKKI